MFLFLEKPYTCERGEIGVLAVIPQEHFRRGHGRPFEDRIHLDPMEMTFGQFRGIKILPSNV